MSNVILVAVVKADILLLFAYSRLQRRYSSWNEKWGDS